VRAAVHGHRRLTRRSLDAAHLPFRFEAPGDLHAEVDRHPRLGPADMMVEEDVVTVGAQTLVLAEKRPDEVERGLEDGWNLAWPSRSANRGEQSGPELLDLHCGVHSPECTTALRGRRTRLPRHSRNLARTRLSFPG